MSDQRNEHGTTRRCFPPGEVKVVTVLDLWLKEHTDRHTAGRCVYCGLSLGECWCGAQESVEYERLVGLDADGAPE